MDITGQSLLQGKLNYQNDVILLSCAQGIYIMTIYKDGIRLKTQKVVIQK